MYMSLKFPISQLKKKLLEFDGETIMKPLLYKKSLKFQIEIKRRIMYKKAKNLGFTHPQVVNCSQELDVLLNKYFARK